MAPWDRTADLLTLSNALLQSFDFREAGFSARRPLGNHSYILKDVLRVLGMEDEDPADEDYAYARELWAAAPEFLDGCRIVLDTAGR